MFDFVQNTSENVLFPHCFSRAQGCITVFHEYFITVKKSSKAWKLTSLTRMLYFAWGQTLLQWLLLKPRRPQLNIPFQFFFLPTVLLLKWLKMSLTLTTVAAYSIWVLYVLFIEWVSVYLSLSLFFFFAFFLFHQIWDSPYFTQQLASCPFSVMISSALCPILWSPL